MRIGDRVQVHVPPQDGLVRSTFHGRTGRVAGLQPAYMVVLDGEFEPLRFGAVELLPVSPAPEPWTAGE